MDSTSTIIPAGTPVSYTNQFMQTRHGVVTSVASPIIITTNIVGMGTKVRAILPLGSPIHTIEWDAEGADWMPMDDTSTLRGRGWTVGA